MRIRIAATRRMLPMAVAFALTVGWGTLSVAPASAEACPNEQLRVGPSANLSDCRAYELVTPEDTGGRIPNGQSQAAGETRNQFPEKLLTPDGQNIIFRVQDGLLPGFDGNGFEDQFEAIRGANGWESRLDGPNGMEVEWVNAGSVSEDHEYSFFELSNSREIETPPATILPTGSYLRGPDGKFGFTAVGSLGDEPGAKGLFIAPHGAHVIFWPGDQYNTETQLEPDAPRTGVRTVYDRTATGTHVISLLPGNVTPTTNSIYQGVSADGSVALFSNPEKLYNQNGRSSATLYARINDERTLPVAASNVLEPGQTATCVGGPKSAQSIAYQWLSNGAPIAGATQPTYTPTAADSGKALQCQTTATNANAGTTWVSGVVEVAPTRSGLPMPNYVENPTPYGPEAGTTETCGQGNWQGTPTSFSYSWYVNGVRIAGATQATYEVKAADVPGAIQCVVTGTNASGSVSWASEVQYTKPEPSPAAPRASAETNTAVVFDGVSSDGRYVFYSQTGEVFVFDTTTETTVKITGAEDAELVNISADGSHVYFVSHQQLDGANGVAGRPNLYVWSAAKPTPDFIATVSANDLVPPPSVQSAPKGCLTCWSEGVADSQPGKDASRSNADGEVLVFGTQAKLTSYENAGHEEIYRYESKDGSLICVSCNPSLQPATADAVFEMPGSGYTSKAISSNVIIQNVTEDGETVFFQTAESLLSADVDGVNDVYEWHDGTVSLISSGHSETDNEIYGMTADGRDLVFRTTDALLGRDHNQGTGGLYDARVDGGFPEPQTSTTCVGSECQGQPTPSPLLAGIGSASFTGTGNVTPVAEPMRHDCSSLQRRAVHLKKAGQPLDRRLRRLRRAGRSRGSRTKLRHLARQRRELQRRILKVSGEAKACMKASGGAGR